VPWKYDRGKGFIGIVECVRVICAELTALLKSMLELDLHRRATVRQVECHRWTRQPVNIVDYDWNTLMSRSRKTGMEH